MLEKLNKTEAFVIAFSGGADSRYLVEKYREKILEGKILKKNIILAHFHHNIRGSESDRDQKFSQNVAKQYGFIFETEKWNIPNPSENLARNARYNFLEKIRKKYNAKWIITAHHKDDQAETIFLQFLRGGGINALTGMRTVSLERKIFRPLLNISKSEILAFLKEKNIPFCEDSTNAKNIFTRNFLRNEIFPLLEKKFPKFSNRIAEKAEYFQNIQDEFEKNAQKFLSKNNFFGNKGVLKKNFLILPSPVQFEIIKKIIFPKFCNQKIFSQIVDFIRNAQSGKKFQIKDKTFIIFGEKIFCE